MKRFELTIADIDLVINERIAFKPNDDSYVKTHRDWRDSLIQELEIINHVLDRKYNKSREPGKSKQQVNAWKATHAKQDRTYKALKDWYEINENNLTQNVKISLSKIVRDTGLSISTVRRFLEAELEKAGVVDKTPLPFLGRDVLVWVFAEKKQIDNELTISNEN